jgi:segregation and condensation protein B
MTKEINFFEVEREVELESSDEPKVLKGPHPEGDTQLAAILTRLQDKTKKTADIEHQKTQTKRVIEALLFAANDPITFNRLREVTEHLALLKPRHLHQLLEELREEYIKNGNAFELIEIGGGYILRTREEYGKYIDLLYRNKRTEKLSPAATETLAIIAYKGPITRPQIDSIRGVDSSGILYSLQDRELVENVGKLEAPGRPSLYAVTTQFMKHFGINDLTELPKLSE